MERYLHIVRINCKLSLLPHLLLSILLLCISPLFIGVENLNASMTSKVLEMFVALLGILLLTPVFLPEQNREIKELVRSKFTSTALVTSLRVLMAVCSLALLVGGYILVLRHNNCVFPMVNFYLGTMAEAVFLGGLGFCAYSFFDQIAIAYMLPIMYYIICFGNGRRYLGNFFLFSMAYGGYHEKVYLAVTGILLIIIGIVWSTIPKRT